MYDQYCLDYGMPVGKVSAMKKTIQRRQLNTMLPPCERTPEAPRNSSRY